MLAAVKRVFWVTGIAGFLLIVFLPGYSKLQELRDKNRDLRRQIDQYRQDNDKLADELERIDHDPVYQEKIVRERMGVVRKGEIPVKVIADEIER